MADPKQIRVRRRLGLLAGAALAAGLFAAVAYADEVLPDGDVVVPGAQTAVDLAPATPGETRTPSVSFTLRCTGKQHVDGGRTVALTFSQSGSRLDGGPVTSAHLTATGTSIGPVSASWPDDTTGAGQTNCPDPAPMLADNGDSAVMITAPSALGAHTFDVRYVFSITPSDPNAVTGSGTSVVYRLDVHPRPARAPVSATPGVESVQLAWAPSLDAAALTEYVVTRMRPGDGETTTMSVPASAASLDDGSVAAGEEYCYSIVARYFDGARSFTSTPTSLGCATPEPANTPPAVAVAGVFDGASYELGAVPAARCEVADLEDGDSSFAAALGPVTGPHASFGLGSQTASCSYTDTGGLSDDASATYSIVDSTAPVLTLPADVVAEATGPSGAAIAFAATAADAVDSAPGVVCTVGSEPVASGDVFPLGTTVVDCTASDFAGNSTSDSFAVRIEDTTAPLLAGLPADLTLEATGPDGAAAGWDAPAASDLVDGSLPVMCSPAAGSVFALGTTVVTCSATDAAGNTGTGGFAVTVRDTTPPSLALPADRVVEATGPAGTAVAYTASASDLVDGMFSPACTPASGSTFPLGSTVVTCSAEDAAGNRAVGAFEVTVRDTTPPELALPSEVVAEATGPDGAAVGYAAVATDLVDGSVAVLCLPAPGSAFPLGTTAVSCSATDAAGNAASGGFEVTVQDTTAPSLDPHADVYATATGAGGATVTYALPPATDLVDPDPDVGCTPPSGSLFAPGATTVSCTATDDAGNTSAASTFTVYVRFDFVGFLPPVDFRVLNGMRAGATAPVKWRVPDGNGGYVSDLAIVERVASGTIGCSGILADDLEAYATGQTSLRYDLVNEQFVYNWQSPKQPGRCYGVRIMLTDGTSYDAAFQLR